MWTYSSAFVLLLELCFVVSFWSLFLVFCDFFAVYEFLHSSSRNYLLLYYFVHVFLCPSLTIFSQEIRAEPWPLLGLLELSSMKGLERALTCNGPSSNRPLYPRPLHCDSWAAAENSQGFSAMRKRISIWDTSRDLGVSCFPARPCLCGVSSPSRLRGDGNLGTWSRDVPLM